MVSAETPIIGGVLGSGGGMWGYFNLFMWVMIGIIVLGGCAFFLYWLVYKRKAWNLDVEIKMVRSNGEVITAEWGKGNYDSKRGVCWIKRKGKKPVAMKPFSTTTYLQGERILTVLQLTPNHYVPVLPNSFTELQDDKTGEEAAVINLKADIQESKAWKSHFERQSKEAYTIKSLLREYAPYIGVGIIMFMNFAGFAILWSQIR